MNRPGRQLRSTGIRWCKSIHHRTFFLLAVPISFVGVRFEQVIQANSSSFNNPEAISWFITITNYPECRLQIGGVAHLRDRGAQALKVQCPQRATRRHAEEPAQLPHTSFHHVPACTACKCGCDLKPIGEDVSESLDYTPGVFTMERHCRGRWACAKCQPPIQAPVPAQFIDDDPLNAVLRGIGLLQKEFLSRLIDPVSEAADGGPRHLPGGGGRSRMVRQRRSPTSPEQQIATLLNNSPNRWMYCPRTVRQPPGGELAASRKSPPGFESAA